jgi:hypothetical protein
VLEIIAWLLIGDYRVGMRVKTGQLTAKRAIEMA